MVHLEKLIEYLDKNAEILKTDSLIHCFKTILSFQSIQSHQQSVSTYINTTKASYPFLLTEPKLG